MSQTPAPRRRPPRPARAALALIPVIGIAALTACGGGASAASATGQVKVVLGAASGTRTVQAGDNLTVTAEGGVLTAVTVTDPQGRQLPGGLGDDGTLWTSSAKAAPDTKYSVVARTKDPRGSLGAIKESVITAKAQKLNKLVIHPGSQGAVIAPDRPITITFDFPVTDRATVERRLTLTADDRVTGAWAWVRDDSGKDRVDWRPAKPSKPGTRLTLRADLNGVDSGGGRYFAKDYHLNFLIGRSCPDSAATRDCGKVPEGDRTQVTASSVRSSSLRGSDDRNTGIGDRIVSRSLPRQNSALTSSS
ncbi:hypothetical protein SSP35_10_01190 [Streptomyces sp. NBRC 110611]|uniref:Ig-like domain-containing protein n=1 Tax=Streptomyces sp. NBRC 110611 TaxID=1621259 RepID=UPI000833D64B|nr:Ig-like domain-containing protein [Streptomyces sp. NBRC 110611]GAU69085.1 hypothetical protein SSP35_10_01190 [Streptomyces sp. NBRC 110611]